MTLSSDNQKIFMHQTWEEEASTCLELCSMSIVMPEIGAGVIYLKEIFRGKN
jgi:hypothetical protein